MRRGHTRHESAVIGCFLEDPISSIPIHSVTSKDVEAWIERRRTIPSGVSGLLCLGRLFQGQPNEAALSFL